ncbi:MAG: TQO small subunit DoxD [Clostridiales bacterium]|jgi:NADH dehydrogenase|nr:DoxX family membrane protein [Eubacteriales bacterium]MDH7566593.1 TQO small subunit DoxD [Clostridiales bacterium]
MIVKHLVKHLSSMSRTFWLVPLRIFLGYTWLIEGIGKINEGWLQKPMLAGLADAVTSASVTETGEKVFRIVSDHTPGWYAWIAGNIVIPHALFFQILIVVSEIGLGLAFISGTFTFLSALVALGLNLNFALSTGLLPETWWMIPAAIAMLCGAGRSFGLDHYLMPFLAKLWERYAQKKKAG